jgi:formylglycine-generating enzyme required for sulfatase activity
MMKRTGRMNLRIHAGTAAVLLAVCAARGAGGGAARGEGLGEPAAFEQRLRGTTATLRMVPIPGGEVRITSEGGEQIVRVRPLYMSATEITWDLYDLFVYRLDEGDGEDDPGVDAVTRPSKPYIPPDRGFGHAGYPAISMSALGAQEFCVWLSAKTGRRFRLATEAEWQHACLSGLPGPYGFEGGAEELGEFAWYKGNSKEKTHAAGRKRPSAWGLHDMHGNAAEWVIGLDGRPQVRGGSYLDPAEDVTALARRRQTPDWNASDPQFPKSQWWLADCTFVGFRVVCEMEGDGHAEERKDDALER